MRIKPLEIKRSESIPRSLGIPNKSQRKIDPKPLLAQSKSLNTFENWKVSKGYSKETKVFIIEGSYPDLKKNLTTRGWIENKDPNSSNFDLLWTRTAKSQALIHDWQIINHFPKNVEISAKWNFCENIKKLKSSFNVNYHTFFPRCFKLSGKDTDEFEENFKAIKSLSILKNYLENRNGQYEKIITSLGICKRWANSLEKDHFPSEKEKLPSLVMQSEWKILNAVSNFDLQVEFKKYFAGKTLVSESDLEQKTKEVVARLEKFDPQFLINGKMNIWIVKPGRKSRGRGISLFTSLEEIKKYSQNSEKWIVQKYIENPLLINNKKFDIRQWVLISNTEPLTIWIYKSCYLRFSAENYEASNLHNLFIHLTNNSISKNSQKFKNSEIEGCMWHLNKFSEFLQESFGENVWENQIYPRIKEIVKWSLMSVGNLGRKNAFEIFGYDFMIDETLKVWLIEVNSSPAMDYSTSVTTELVQQVLNDSMKVVLGPEEETGQFEIIFKGKPKKL